MRVFGWVAAGCLLSMLYVTSVPAQFGGGGLGGGGLGGGDFGNSLGVWVSSESVIVVMAKSRDSAAAWSRTTGEWKRIEFKSEEAESLTPVVANHVVAFRAGHRIYAFGDPSGQWDSIAVSEKLRTIPVVGNGYASVQEDGKFFVFSSAAGKWGGVELESAKLIQAE